MQEITNYQGSPFDAIRQVNEQGCEYWIASDLQNILGYTQWRRFQETIERAMVSSKNSGSDVAQNFVSVGKLSHRDGNLTSSTVNYHLTRYACYLVAMNGDPRKPEIAAAQTYFAIKTREAEIGQSYVNADFELRLQLNKGLVPYDHWTVLEEIDKECHRNGIGLIKLIGSARPDISVGKMWANHLKETGEDVPYILIDYVVDPKTRTTAQVRAYTLDSLPDFRRWMHSVYNDHFKKHYLPERIKERMEANVPKQLKGTSLKFDYNYLTSEGDRSYLKQMAKEIHILSRSKDRNTFKMGKILIAVKDKMPSKLFDPWVEAELPMTSTVAQRLMRVTRKFGDKSAQLEHLPFTLLIEMAKPCMPQGVNDRIIAGEYTPSVDEIRGLTAVHRQNNQEPIMIRDEQPSSQASIQDLIAQLQQQIDAFTPEIQVKEVVKYVTPVEVLEENAKLREEANKYYTRLEKSTEDLRVAREEIAQLIQKCNMIMKDRNSFVERYESLLQEYTSLHQDMEKPYTLIERFIDAYKQICADEKISKH